MGVFFDLHGRGNKHSRDEVKKMMSNITVLAKEHNDDEIMKSLSMSKSYLL
jgi:predicted Zn-dependent protease with MMP-like domain